MSEKPTEEEFLARYDGDYVVKSTARKLYRELYPTGMHTNGPCRVTIDASHLHRLLSRWEIPK